VWTTARWLARHGHTVHIVYVGKLPDSAKSKEAPPNLRVHCAEVGNRHYYARRLGLGRTTIPMRLRNAEFSVGLARTLKSIQQTDGLDLVEIFEGFSNPVLFEGLPFIFKMHGAEWTFRRYCEDGRSYPFETHQQRAMILAARQTQSLSRSLADFIAGACDVPRRLIQVMPYPIELAEFQPAQPPTQGPPFHLMAVGRLQKRKGTHTAVAALRKVWESEPETHLHLYGGHEDFGQAQIEAIIPATEHRGRIHFEGFVPRDQLVARYQNVHVHLAPTRYETFGYTLLEAMACGRPVIASDIGPVPDLVRHEETGWLVPRDDTDALAAAILTAFHNPAQREAYGRAGRTLAEGYDIDRILTAQVSLYETALKGARV
jgi:glycosyltransferase involved in cell wall biosynthesis